jgi:ubiquinone/menaquinone biosynthesis C-methylase UbiE
MFWRQVRARHRDGLRRDDAERKKTRAERKGDTASQAQVDAAKAYEALFVPALFGQWVSRVADAGQVQPGQHLLDVAMGENDVACEPARRDPAR